MRSRVAHTALAFLVALGAASAGDAHAAPHAGDKAAAQALFDEGLKLMTSGRLGQACPKLEESLRLDPAMGTRFRLSECWEAVGRTASAWAGYVEVADLARAAGQASREKVARERAAHLEPTLCHLEIAVATPGLAGLEIRRDGVVVGAAQWGATIPVDPGTVRLTASAPGKAPWKGEATLAKGGQRAVVRVPALEDAPAGTTPSPLPSPSLAGAPSPAAVTPAAPPDAATEPPPTSARKTLGGVVFGVGVAGIGASGVLGLVALAKYNGTSNHCTGDVCDPAGKQATDSARSLGTVATVVFGVGAALALGGAVVWATAPPSASGPANVAGASATAAAPIRVRVRVAPQAVFVEGVF